MFRLFDIASAPAYANLRNFKDYQSFFDIPRMSNPSSPAGARVSKTLATSIAGGICGYRGAS